MKNRIKIALAGNPNSGKSTVFNALTGLNQKVANFPGVTVDKKTGLTKLKRESDETTVDVEIIDLPGSYSLYPKTPDERIPFQVLCDPKDDSHPDMVVFIADASNLKRSLFFCSQIIDLKIPVILVLNMMDLVASNGLEINIESLSQKLGVPVISTNALRNEGIPELKKVITDLPYQSPPDFIEIHSYAPEMLAGICETVKVNSDYAAFQIANNLELISFFQISSDKKNIIRDIIKKSKFDAHSLQTKETIERYKVISELISQTVIQKNLIKRKRLTERFDNVLTHRILGYVIFLLILFLVFQAIFSWSSYPMDWIQNGFLWLSSFIQSSMPPGMLSELIVNGILAGLSGIIVFIPQIASLFFFIALLEDSGYMARVSFIMDRLMRPFGLNGKSVIPLISGVACAIPAIMSTRTISNKKERILTILVTPLMSCSARIPVYTLLISLIVPKHFVFGVLNLQGIVLMALYLIGFIAAIGSAWILKLFIHLKESTHFIMEMPVYRMPRWSNIGLTIIEKVKIFLFDAGKIIIAISIILWFLSSYGPSAKFKEIENKYSISNQQQDFPSEKLAQMKAEKLENSYAGIIGKSIEPVIRPLGFDWKIGIALITSFAAREVFVGTMSTIYSIGDVGEGRVSVRDKMLAEINPQTGKHRFSVATGFSLMIFYAFALQCMSTIAVVYRESKSWKWPLIQFLYMGVLAYVFSLITYQLLK